MAVVYIRFVHCTCRWNIVESESARLLREGDDSFVAAVWHGRLLMMPLFPRSGRRVWVLVSRHRDGEFIARILRFLGANAVRGSSSKGAYSASRELLGILSRGEVVVITPDGPRGPYRKAAIGAVRLAKKTGVPIIPMAYSVSRAKELSSWDRFMLAMPFSRGVYVCGEPFVIGKEEAPDVACERFEETLNRVTDQADAYVEHGVEETG